MSLTELYESPFHVTAVMNEGFASAEKTGFVLLPRIDTNTNLTVGETQVQNCAENTYSVTVRDWFAVEIDDLPALEVKLRLVDGAALLEEETGYFLHGQHFVVLDYCAYGFSGQESVEVAIKGDPVGTLAVTLLPGPFSLPHSELIEILKTTAPTTCHVSTLCQVRLTLKDVKGNAVRTPQRLTTAADMDFQWRGPLETLLDNGSPNSVFFQNFTVGGATDPAQLYIDITPAAPGTYELYARFEGVEAPVFPVTMTVISEAVSAEFTGILPQSDSTIDSQVATVPLTFTVLMRDEAGALVTSSNSYDLSASLTLLDNL